MTVAEAILFEAEQIATDMNPDVVEAAFRLYQWTERDGFDTIHFWLETMLLSRLIRKRIP